MNKKAYILIAFVVASLIFVIVFIIINNSKNQQSATSNNSAPAPGNYYSLPISELQKEDKLEIPTNKGTVNINNVYKNPVEQLSQNGVSFTQNSDYYMSFYPKNNGFLITLLNPDLEKARSEAENDFINKLGITKDQACSLNVSITIPNSVSTKYSGGIYNFSFCPGSTPFN
jgi:hypothetical protein